MLWTRFLKTIVGWKLLAHALNFRQMVPISVPICSFVFSSCECCKNLTSFWEMITVISKYYRWFRDMNIMRQNYIVAA